MGDKNEKSKLALEKWNGVQRKSYDEWTLKTFVYFLAKGGLKIKHEKIKTNVFANKYFRGKGMNKLTLTNNKKHEPRFEDFVQCQSEKVKAWRIKKKENLLTR